MEVGEVGVALCYVVELDYYFFIYWYEDVNYNNKQDIVLYERHTSNDAGLDWDIFEMIWQGDMKT